LIAASLWAEAPDAVMGLFVLEFFFFSPVSIYLFWSMVDACAFKQEFLSAGYKPFCRSFLRLSISPTCTNPTYYCAHFLDVLSPTPCLKSALYSKHGQFSRPAAVGIYFHSSACAKEGGDVENRPFIYELITFTFMPNRPRGATVGILDTPLSWGRGDQELASGPVCACSNPTVSSNYRPSPFIASPLNEDH